MVGRPKKERALYVTVLAVVALAIGIIVLTQRPTPAQKKTTNTNNPSRLTYATLYDGLWRQDEGRGSVLMTATLFVPPMVTALGTDTQRSEVEDQLWNTTKSLSDQQLAIYLTFDSVSGYLTDQQIEQALQVTTTPTMTVKTITWQPIIGGQSAVNANVAVHSQRGLAIITMADTVNWSKLQSLTLQAKNIADQPLRQFVWNQISSLVSAE